MRYCLISVLAVLLASCFGEESSSSKAAPKPKKPKPAAQAQPAQGAAAANPRESMLAAEYEGYRDFLITHEATGLDVNERIMVVHLLQAAKLIEQLHMLQIHPKNLEWWRQVQASGTEVERKVFARYQLPWCLDNSAAECSVLAEMPKRQIGQAFWPEDLTDEQFAGLSKEPNASELLSPFTVVRRKKEGGFEALPYAKTELFGPLMRKVAAQLRSASEKAPDQTLASFLASRAAAFETETPFPYDESDYDWIAVQGKWEVAVGPYETYRDPRDTKAMFEMYIGKEDAELTKELGRFRESLQEMENALAKLVGTQLYKSRKLDPRIAIRAIDVWMASGDGRRDRGATVAFHLPNRGKPVEEGLYKKVLMVNHATAFEPVMRGRAELILDPSLLAYVDTRADINNVMFHEFAHGFGAHHELKIKGPDGQETTVQQALQELDSIFEEAKADSLGLWLLQFQKRKGWISSEQAKKSYVTALMHILGLQQYPLDGTYPLMVSMQLGWYLDAGAVTWNEKEGRYYLDVEKMPGAVESFAKEVSTIQLTGDRARAKALFDKYIVAKQGGGYELKPPLAALRTAMVDKFKKAGLKSPSLRYEVTKL